MSIKPRTANMYSGDWIEIASIGLCKSAVMFGRHNADIRKYIPKKNMKFPKTIGYGFLMNLIR